MIGRGGMGLVYAARHLRLGERVAVKLLLPQIASRPDARVRFEREGRAAARLKSEHIARVHDAGSLPSGALYLVLELLRGHDLRTEIAERGPLPVEVATAYLAQACEGVAEAHSIGVIHRDLKPANLFLAERPDGSRIVKILDFGVSRLLPIAEDATAPAHLTASESAVGTPHYMAPEQMRAARDASPASDVYALGATLYGLLVGESPFQGETMVAVYDRIMAGPPSARARRPDVPEALDAVIARCLALRPEDRYPDVGALALALAPFMDSQAATSAERAGRILRNTAVPVVAAPPARTALSVGAPEDKAAPSGVTSATDTQTPKDPSWPVRARAHVSAPPAIAEAPRKTRSRVRAALIASLVIAVAASLFAAFRETPPPPSAASPATSVGPIDPAASAEPVSRKPSSTAAATATPPDPVRTASTASAREPARIVLSAPPPSATIAPTTSPSGTSSAAPKSTASSWSPGPLDLPN